jgi:lipopolysaccharide assembly outer membrane protein LptD (OstA)
MIRNYLYHLLILFFMILILFYFYKKFYEKETKIDLKSYEPLKENLEEKILAVEDNLITNLNYFSKDINDNQYIIKADFGYTTKRSEIIEMTNPTAKIIFNDGSIITVAAKKALYNQQNYNSNFIENVKIRYNDKMVTANKMDLDFISNNVKIYGDILYKDFSRTLSSEYLDIDLITKDILINSNNEKKVNLKTSY